MKQTKQVELPERAYSWAHENALRVIEIEMDENATKNTITTLVDTLSKLIQEYEEKCDVLAQAQQEAEQRGRDEVWSMVMTHTDIFDKYPSLKNTYLQKEQE